MMRKFSFINLSHNLNAVLGNVDVYNLTSFLYLIFKFSTYHNAAASKGAALSMTSYL